MIKRPLVWILGAFLPGVILARQAISIGVVILIGLIYSVLLSLLWLKKPDKLLKQIQSCFSGRFISHEFKKDWFLWFLPLMLLLGFLAARSQMKLPALYDAFEQEVPCEFSGQISMVVEKEQGRALYVKNNMVSLYGEETYPCETIIVYSSDPQPLLVGNRITVRGSLIKFTRATNPGQFNEQEYYKIEDIDFKAEADSITVTDSSYSAYHAILGKLKTRLIQSYSSILDEKEAGTLIAMLLGEKNLLEEEIKQLYQSNGISHVLAISGLHISLIGMGIFKLLRKCRLPQAPAVLVTIGMIYSYGVLTNFSVSTNRAIVMMTLQLLAPLFSKTYDMLSSTALSALIILLQNPLQLFSAGFLLSFTAILGIAVLLPCLKRLFPRKNPVLDGLLASAGATLATTPVVLYFFYQFPTYGLLINLLILPLVSLLTLSAILAGIAGVVYLPLGIFLAGGPNYILKLYEAVCRAGAALPASLLTVGKPDPGAIFLSYLLLLVFVIIAGRGSNVRHDSRTALVLSNGGHASRAARMPDNRQPASQTAVMLKTKGLPWRDFLHDRKKSGLVLLALSLLVLLVPIRDRKLEITVLDVGQGDGIFLRSGSGTAYLIDGGSTDVKKAGTYRLLPFLKSRGVDHIDYAFMTHSDADHISGLTELIEGGQPEIGCLVLPEINPKDEHYLTLEALAKDKRIPVRYISTGDEIIDGDLTIDCLHPSPDYVPSSANAYSTVLSVSFGEFDMLFTGDIGENEEERICEGLQSGGYRQTYGINPAADYDVLNKKTFKMIQFRFLCSDMQMA